VTFSFRLWVTSRAQRLLPNDNENEPIQPSRLFSMGEDRAGLWSNVDLRPGSVSFRVWPTLSKKGFCRSRPARLIQAQ